MAHPATSDDCIPVLKALADGTRLRIVHLLLQGPRQVGQISDQLDVSLYNVSKHLRILREADLVEMRKDGKAKECSLVPSFRKQIEENQYVLDLGCCTFRFDQEPPANPA